jgi:hypothetical protein
MPEISFIIGFRNRDLKRVRSFIESVAAQTLSNFELIFLDYGSEPSLAEKVKTEVESYSFAHYHYIDTRGQNWNRGRCLNEAATRATGTHIFTCDVDFVFVPEFTQHLKTLLSNGQPEYFKVGFMKQDTPLKKQFSEEDVDYYSDADAIGAILVPKSVFEEIGGFDEYFEIWGLEDNDLLYRLRKKGYALQVQTKHCFIYHIWHLPAKQEGIIPEGWLKLLSDHLKAKKEGIIADAPFHSLLDPSRPLLTSNTTHVRQVSVGHFTGYFLAELLEDTWQTLADNEILELHFDFSKREEFESIRTFRWKSKINRLLKKRAIPIVLKHSYDANFLSRAQAVQTVQFFLKRKRKEVRDYFLPSDLSAAPIRLMKRHDV